MSDNPTSPLLGGTGETETERGGTTVQRPRSQKSTSSSQSKSTHGSDESTPLLSRNTDGDGDGYGGVPDNAEPPSPATSSLRSLQSGGSGKGKSTRKWPTFVALAFLTLTMLAILGLGFAAPAVVEEYAKQAAVFEPTELSIDSFTPTGVRARIRGDFMMDASRVEKKPVRDLGRAGTWLARAVESKPSKVQVFLPEYDNVLLGTAAVPSIVVDIRDGHITHIDILTDLEPGDIDGIRRIANDWIEGRLGQLRVLGRAEIPLKSGIFGLGTQIISESMLFEGHDLPDIPKYNITKFNIHEVQLSESSKGMAADVSISLMNNYPVSFTVPPLGFDILVLGCPADPSFLLLANATTEEIPVEAKQLISANVNGVIRQLPKTLTTVCPSTDTSPLDILLGDYMHGLDTTLFVRGANAPPGDTPSWMSALIKDVVVPLPFPGHTFDNLISDFSMKNVHLGMPDPSADPDSPEAQPRISAVVEALVILPKEMNFPINIPRVRADADVYYHNKKLGVLDLHKWQSANATRVDSHVNKHAGLKVSSVVQDAPLTITDDDVFADVIQALIFGGKPVILGVKAVVDIETDTALGKFIVRKIPAEGKVPIKPLSGGNLTDFSPKVGSLKILETSKSGIFLEAAVNITNPTEYSVTVPYVNIYLLTNGTRVGHGTAENVALFPGQNDNIRVQATWDPLNASGKQGVEAGRELLSQYISGYNTTLGLRTHEGTIPSQPALGRALSSFEVKIPTPKLTPPKNPNHDDDDDDDDDNKDDGGPRFIDDAMLHLFTSTATFTLLSPLAHTTLFLTHVNATAYYNHTEPVGLILYDLPFAVPPGATTSPRLPVDWSLGSVGYEAVKQALGGTLKLDATATVGVMIGQWQETVWFKGGGIGAHVQL